MGIFDIPPQYLAIGFAMWILSSVFFIWRNELIAAAVFALFFFGQVLLDLVLKGQSIPNGQLTILIFGPLLLYSVAFRQKVPVIFGNVLLFVLMAVVMVFSMIWNQLSFWEYKSSLIPILFAIIIYLSVSDMKALKTVLLIFMVFMVLNNIVSGLQYAGFDQFYLPVQERVKDASGFRRGPGLMNHFWQTGLISATAVPIAIMSAITEVGKLRKVLWLGIFFSAMAGLLFSALRAGFGGSVLGTTIVLFLWNPRKAIPLLAGGMVLIGVLVTVVPIFRTSSNALIVHSTTVDNSAKMRPILAEEGITLWKDSPIFGVGPKGVSRAYGGNKGGNAHNSYISQLSDYGLIGLGVFLVILVAPLLTLKRAVSTMPEHSGVLLGLMGALISIYIVAIVHSVDDITQFWMFPALSLAVGRIRLSFNANTVSKPLKPKARSTGRAYSHLNLSRAEQ